MAEIVTSPNHRPNNQVVRGADLRFSSPRTIFSKRLSTEIKLKLLDPKKKNMAICILVSMGHREYMKQEETWAYDKGSAGDGEESAYPYRDTGSR